MGGLFAIIGNLLSIISAYTDPAKKEKAFHLALRKNGKKAMDVAEDIFDLMDDYMAGDLHEYRFKKQYKKLKKRFNDLD